MRTALIGLLLLSFVLAACGGGGGDPAAPERAVRAAGIADEIARNPDQIDSILGKHGMTVEVFEALLMDISEDEALSKAYEEARKVPTPK